jgi:hypothetical protein
MIQGDGDDREGNGVDVIITISPSLFQHVHSFM